MSLNSLSTISAFAHRLILSFFFSSSFCFFINYSKEHDFSSTDIERTGKNSTEPRERERETARKEIKKKSAIQLIIANREREREIERECILTENKRERIVLLIIQKEK